MLYYPNNYNVQNLKRNNNDRFLFPFLGGALIGGAAVGLTRPRPIYNVAPYPYYQRPYPYAPYGNYSYNYYYPRPY